MDIAQLGGGAQSRGIEHGRMQKQMDDQAKGMTRGTWAWIFYDWANSAFVLTVATVFAGPLFQQFWWDGDPDKALFWNGLNVTLASVGVALTALKCHAGMSWVCTGYELGMYWV